MKRTASWTTMVLTFLLSAPVVSGTDSLVDVGGHSLHLFCQGKGNPTVLLDAGLGGTHLDWALVQPKLAQSTHVCSYDRAGYGLSEMGPNPRDANTLAKEAGLLLQKPELSDQVILVAHSLAGFHLRQVAQHNPDKVLALVLIESAHEDQFDEFLQRAKLRLAPDKGDRIRLSPPSVPKQLPADKRQLAQSYANEQKSLLTLRSELTNFSSSAKSLQNSDSSIEQPVLVISRGLKQWANSDQAELREEIWQELQSRLNQLSKHSAQIIASDSGHFVHLEQPALVIDVLRGMVEGLRAKSDLHQSIITAQHGECDHTAARQWRCASPPASAALQ